MYIDLLTDAYITPCPICGKMIKYRTGKQYRSRIKQHITSPIHGGMKIWQKYGISFDVSDEEFKKQFEKNLDKIKDIFD